MVFGLLIILQLGAYANVYRNGNSAKCDQFNLYRYMSCLPFCPAGYSKAASSAECIKTSETTIISGDFFSFTKFTAKSFKNFNSSLQLAFNDSSRNSPVPTKSQGFFFNRSSGLQQTSYSILAPDHCFSIYFRVYNNGSIFEAKQGEFPFLSLNFVDNVIKFNANLTTLEVKYDYRTIYSFVQPNSWIYFKIIHLQGNNTVNYKIFKNNNYYWGNTLYFLEFRIPGSQLNYTFGSLSQQSFSGFIYYFCLMNDDKCPTLYYDSIKFCEINQYLSVGTCANCSQADMWPPCVRNTSNLCYSENCSDCSGFSMKECLINTVDSGSCKVGKNCLEGCEFNCSSCQSGHGLSAGVCLPDSRLAQIISMTFNESKGFYGNFFKSGANSSTYYLANSPETDDPLPLYQRGLYFNGSSFLTSNETVLNANLTVVLWTYSLSNIVTIFAKQNLKIFTNFTTAANLSNNAGSKMFSTQRFGKDLWIFMAVAIEYTEKISTIRVYDQNNLLWIETAIEYVFYDVLGSILIKPEKAAFLYMISIYPSSEASFPLPKKLCSSEYITECLFHGDKNWYFYHYVKRPCDISCINGCKTGGTCNVCKSIMCETCSYFDSDCTESSTYNPCLNGLQLNSKKSICCDSKCSDCYDVYDFTCTRCNTGFYLLKNKCYQKCPTLYQASGSNCISTYPYSIIEFNKTYIPASTSPIVYYDSNYSSINFSESSKPIAAKSRGFYFKNNTFIYTNPIILQSNLIFGYWLRQTKQGVIFVKNELSFSTTGILNLPGITAALSISNIFNKWELMMFATWYNPKEFVYSYDDFEATFNFRMLTNNSWPRTSYFYSFDDKLSELKIGNSTNGFEGFIYMFYLYFSYETMKLYTPGNLWDCNLTLYSINNTCLPCESKCINGCAREVGCSICNDSICHICENYTSICSQCKENASLINNKCECNAGFLWNSSKDSCELCDPNKNLTILNFSCVCKDGFFNNSAKCEACHPDCSKCSGSGNTSCINCALSLEKDNTTGLCKCKNGLIDVSNNGLLGITGSQKCQCPDGSYKSGELCLTRHASCLTCNSGTALNCTKCKEGAYLSLSSSCVCNTSYYQENNNCFKCHESCLSCIGQGNKNCTSCRTNYTFIATQSVCLCLHSFGEVNNTCEFCNSEKNLTIVDSLCVCKDGLFNNTQKCETCHTDCLTCSGPENTSCIKCASSMEKDNSTGLCKCKNGLIDISLSSSQPITGSEKCQCLDGYYKSGESCLSCHLSCLTCKSGSDVDCIKCKEGAYLTASNKCTCNKYYYEENYNCFKCHTSCLDCVGAGNKNCSSCRVNYTSISSPSSCVCLDGFTEVNNICEFCDPTKNLIIINSSCVCKDGYFNNTKSCEICHPDCLTCSGSGNSSCLKCVLSLEKDNITELCKCKTGLIDVSLNGSLQITGSEKCQCLDGYYKSGESCLRCHPSCQTCKLGSDFDCIKCKEGAYLTASNKCTCNKYYYEENYNCFKCHASCLDCVGAGNKNCSSCRANYTSISSPSSCVCLNGFTEVNNVCEFCDPTKNLIIINSSCVCKDGYFNNTKSCEICHPDCLTCSGSGNTSCLKCVLSLEKDNKTNLCKCKTGLIDVSLNGSLQITGSEKCQCLDGYYKYIESCLMCHPTCLMCKSGTSLDCIKCKEGAHLKASYCVCNISYYQEGDDCLKCTDSCLKCSDSSYFSCLNCNSSILFGMCFKNCPLGYLKQSSNCIQNDSLALSFRFDGNSPALQEMNTEKFAVPCLPDSAIIAYNSKGIYFNGLNSCLRFNPDDLNQPMIGPSFFVYLWARCLNDVELFEFFSSQNFSFSLKLASISYFSLVLNQEPLLEELDQNHDSSKWNHFIVGLNYSANSDFLFTVNNNLVKKKSLTKNPFKDMENSTLVLGSKIDFLSFFKGFIFSFEIYNTFVDPEVFLTKAEAYCDYFPRYFNKCLDFCDINQFVSEDFECKDCSSRCKFGCIDFTTCQTCKDPNCNECDPLNLAYCIKCLYRFESRDGICEECSTTQYFNTTSHTCDNCHPFCLSCTSFKTCKSCIDKFQLNSQHFCECQDGLELNGSICEQIYFKVGLVIFTNNSFLLKFEHELKTKLSPSYLEVTVDQTIFNSEIKKIDATAYLVDIKNLESIDLTQSHELFIKFIQSIFSIQNFLLLNQGFRGILFKNQISEALMEAQVQVKTVSKYGKAMTVTTGSAAAGSAFIGMNPVGVFNFLNMIEIFLYSMLFDVEFDSGFLDFIDSLKATSKIPNPVPKYLNVRTNIKKKYQKLGIENSYFLVNSIVSLMFFSLLLVLHLISRYLRNASSERLKKIGDGLRKRLVFGFYLRFFIQFTFEMSLFGLISICYTEIDGVFPIFDLIASYVFLILILLVLFMIILKLLRFYKSGSNPDEIDEILTEFNKEELSSTLYYVLFIIRRIFLSISIVLISDPILQVIICLVFTLIVRFKKVLFYLIIVKPYKVKLALIFNITNEVHIAGYYLFLMYCINNSSSNSLQSTKTYIYIIMSTLAVSAVYNIVDGAISIHRFIKRCKNRNKVIPAIVTTVVYPIELKPKSERLS